MNNAINRIVGAVLMFAVVMLFAEVFKLLNAPLRWVVSKLSKRAEEQSTDEEQVASAEEDWKIYSAANGFIMPEDWQGRTVAAINRNRVTYNATLIGWDPYGQPRRPYVLKGEGGRVFSAKQIRFGEGFARVPDKYLIF